MGIELRGDCIEPVSALILPQAIASLCLFLDLPFLSGSHGLRRSAELVVVPCYRGETESGGRCEDGGVFPRGSGLLGRALR